MLSHDNDIFTLVAKKDLIVSGARDKSVRVWSIPEKREIARFYHDGPVVHVAMNGDIIVSGSEDNTVRAWSLSRKKEILRIRGYDGEDIKLKNGQIITGTKKYHVSLQ